MKRRILLSTVPAFATAAIIAFCAQGTTYADVYNPETTISSDVSTDMPFICKLNKNKPSYAASIKDELYINDNNYLLYPTFDDPEKAIEAISSDAKATLDLLSKTYNLKSMSSYNWQQYRDAMLNIHDNPDKPDWYCETSDEYDMLLGFFDLYENAQSNAEIELLSTNATASTKSISEGREILEILNLLLPDQKTLGNEQAETPVEASITRTTVLDFNIGKGLTYAEEHATKPNTKIYKYFANGDCANFASQILEAGGVKQINKSPDKTSGWWHIHNINNAFNPHTHSRSWTEAKTFAKYMGVTYSTKSNKAFSANIKKGDFIAFDKESDGDYDHIGFVTGVATSKTGNYYPYKVAQHTNNYNEWTTSNTNNWEKLGAQGSTYARIRR